MALVNTARPIKRHSSFLDLENYENMTKVKNKTGLSLNRQINEALSKFYIPHMTDEVVSRQKKINTLQSLSNDRLRW